MRKITPAFTAVFIILFFLSQAKGSEADEPQFSGYMHTYDQAFGLAAGGTSGTGFSYRRWPGNAGLQLNFIPIFRGPEEDDWISAGLSGLYMLNRHETFNLYLQTSASYQNENGEDSFSAGIAPSIEVSFEERFGTNFSLGYGIYDIFDDQTQINYTGEVGVFLYF